MCEQLVARVCSAGLKHLRMRRARGFPTPFPQLEFRPVGDPGWEMFKALPSLSPSPHLTDLCGPLRRSQQKQQRDRPGAAAVRLQRGQGRAGLRGR